MGLAGTGLAWERTCGDVAGLGWSWLGLGWRRVKLAWDGLVWDGAGLIWGWLRWGWLGLWPA
jgi:hypothetical protein